MNCDDVARSLSDDLDGEVSFWKRLGIRLHLLMCPPCQKGRAALRRTVNLLGGLPEQPLTDIEPDDRESPS